MILISNYLWTIKADQFYLTVILALNFWLHSKNVLMRLATLVQNIKVEISCKKRTWILMIFVSWSFFEMFLFNLLKRLPVLLLLHIIFFINANISWIHSLFKKIVIYLCDSFFLCSNNDDENIKWKRTKLNIKNHRRTVHWTGNHVMCVPRKRKIFFINMNLLNHEKTIFRVKHKKCHHENSHDNAHTHWKWQSIKSNRHKNNHFEKGEK